MLVPVISISMTLRFPMIWLQIFYAMTNNGEAIHGSTIYD